MTSQEIEKKIDDLLTRGVGQFVDPNGAFRKKLQAKAEGKYPKDIVIKFGVDPTRPDIHLGHAVILRKLRGFQELGCKVIFLIGDYTASIGDPTGKSKVRPEVEQKEIEENMKTYLEQVGKILRTDAAVFSWIRNSDWFYGVADIFSPKEITITQDGTSLTFPKNSFLAKAAIFDQSRMQRTHLKKESIESLTFRGLLWTLRHITHGRLIQRDMFQERIKNGEELYMHEMLYPVIQGIDSFILSQIYGSCDLEVGGTDQTFNMLMGRDVMKVNHAEEQSVLSFELLVGTDGKEKMSKSLDNFIAITDVPFDMYGKVMSVPDSALITYFALCTYTPLDMIEDIFDKIKKGGNPRDAKMRLAKEIVSIYHGEAKAVHAEEEYIKTFQKGGVPEGIPEIDISHGESEAFEILKKCFGEEKSNTEIRRLFDEGAITIGNEKITDPKAKITPKNGQVIKAGKKTWFKVKMG
ncbi:MAG: tyrosine--tRNA ligase [Candidatus Paceibacterota bacterium]|jgi:tyrosyl-tRNA synthetase|nr:tyrosine--tRNA ligase [Candidatus Paceibacterota bacterium]